MAHARPTLSPTDLEIERLQGGERVRVMIRAHVRR